MLIHVLDVCTCEVCLRCQRVWVSATSIFGDKVICGNSGFTFQAFIMENTPDILPPFQDGFLAHPAFRKTCSMLVYLLNIACLFSISPYMYKRTTSEAKGKVARVKLV